MSPDDFLNERRKALEESVKFFNSDHKSEREKYVVETFLDNLGLIYSDAEIEPVSDDPPDIRFRGAQFEIKELMDPGRRRHLEYKNALAKATAATNPAELLEHIETLTITAEEVYRRILQTSSDLLNKYPPSTCRTLDLLFYINLVNVMDFIEEPLPNMTSLRSQPWRSVSYILGHHRASVLVARSDAPSFIIQSCGKIYHRRINSG